LLLLLRERECFCCLLKKCDNDDDGGKKELSRAYIPTLGHALSNPVISVVSSYETRPTLACSSVHASGATGQISKWHRCPNAPTPSHCPNMAHAFRIGLIHFGFYVMCDAPVCTPRNTFKKKKPFVNKPSVCCCSISCSMPSLPSPPSPNCGKHSIINCE